MTLASRYRLCPVMSSSARPFSYKIYDSASVYTAPRKSVDDNQVYNRDNEIVGATRGTWAALTGKNSSSAICRDRASSLNFNEERTPLISVPPFIIPIAGRGCAPKIEIKRKKCRRRERRDTPRALLISRNLMSDRRWFTGIRCRAGISQISGLMASPWRTHPFAKNRPAVKCASSAKLVRRKRAKSVCS